MLLDRIWKRYFIWEALKAFCLFLLGFYALYVLIDYSNHSGSFKHHHFRFLDIMKFYGFEFFVRMDVLVPFAVMIACIKTLCACNANNELVALMCSGISLRSLLRPFVYLGIFFTLAIYLNTEKLQPYAVKYHNRLEESRTKKKQQKSKHPIIQQIALDDGSSIIFQYYDSTKQQFFDNYWIRSIDDIYRIKHLSPYADVPKGEIIEHLQRDAEGKMIVTEMLQRKTFPEMHFDAKALLATVAVPSEQSISELKEKLPESGTVRSDKEAQILTAYYYKLAFPWLCLLAVIAPAPFCTRFSRSLPVFFIYAGCIFGMVAFYIILDAAVVLGERQVVSPEAAILAPFATAFAFFGWKFFRL